MLTDAFPRIADLRIVQLMREFFRSGWYAACIVFLMVCSELFALELAVIYCYFTFGVLVLLFCEDTLGIVPMICCGYMLFSARNNPGKFPDTALFSQPYAQLQLFFIIAVVVVLLAGRLAGMLLEKGQRSLPRLTVGFAALGLAYVLGGIFSPFYSGRTAFFGFVQIASLCLFYFYLYFTLRWEKVPKGYISMLFTILGVGVVAQVAGMYFNEGVFTAAGVNRAALYTGWGIYNNVGCVMAMCMPAPVYLAITRRNGWLYTVVACCFYLAVLLTQSRTSMLFGTLVFAACVLVTLIGARGKERIWHGIVYFVLAAAAAACAVVFWDRVSDLFWSVISVGWNDFSRFDTWKACWDRFLQYPSFGVGFYKTPGTVMIDNEMNTTFEGFPDGSPDGWFMPPRSHNTVFQLMATGGAFALVAYAVHRAETLFLFFRHPSKEKTVCFLCVAAMLLTSLLDCHLFNFGPGLLYSVLLVFTEISDAKEEKAHAAAVVPAEQPAQ